MSIEQIQKKIENRNKELEEKLLVTDEEIEFLRQFLCDNPIQNYTKILDINLKDFMIAYLLATTDNKLNYLQNKLEIVSDFLEKTEQLDYTYVVNKIAVAINKITTNHIEGEEKEKIIAKQLRNISIVKDKIYPEILNKEGYYNLVELSYKNPKEMSDIFSIINDIASIKIIIKQCGVVLDMAKSFLPNTIRKKTHDKITKEQIKKRVNLDTLENGLSTIKDYLNPKIEKQEIEHRNYQKEIQNNNKFLKYIFIAIKQPVIENHEELIKLLKNEEIIKDALILIYNHNLKAFDKINLEYENLTKDSLLKYKALLSTYKLESNDYDIRKMKNYSIEELKEMINTLKELELNHKTQINIIENSDLDTVNIIKDYKRKGVLDLDFLKENYNILIKNSEEYKTFIYNMELLKEFNPANFINSQDVLLENNDLLQSNIEVLKNYQYDNSIKGIQNYNFLNKEDLEEIIDTFLEVGLEEEIEENISILNEKNINRLVLLKELDLLEDNKENLKEILQKSSFMMPDSKIEEYLEKNYVYKIPLRSVNYEIDLEDMKEFDNSKRTYKIEDMIFSKNRVKKVYQNIDESDKDRLIKSFIINSIYSPEKVKTKFYNKGKI